MRPLTPALSRREREKGARVSIVSKKTYPDERTGRGKRDDEGHTHVAVGT
jgi:hypothetical protein